MTFGLGAISWEFGEPCSVDSAAAGSEVSGDPSDLLAMGFETFLRSERSVTDLGTASLAKSLAASSLSAGDIDAVVFCTSTFPGSVSALQADLETRLRAMAFRHTNLFLLSFGRCANVASALSFAEYLLAQGNARHVAIITADRHTPELGPRNSQNNTQIMSDAAASCIIGEAVEQVRIERVIRRSDLNVTTQGLVGTSSERIDAYANYHRLINVLRDQGGFFQADALVTHNMAVPSIRAMAKAFGVAADLLVEQNVPRMGHAFGADGLVNLQACLDRAWPTADLRRVAMLLTGINTHSVVHLTFQPGPPILEKSLQ